jgi:hypothetical protein
LRELSNQVTELLTNQSTNQVHGTILPEKLTVPKLVKNFSAIYGMKIAKLENYTLQADLKTYSLFTAFLHGGLLHL